MFGVSPEERATLDAKIREARHAKTVSKGLVVFFTAQLRDDDRRLRDLLAQTRLPEEIE